MHLQFIAFDSIDVSNNVKFLCAIVEDFIQFVQENKDIFIFTEIKILYGEN